MLEEYWFRGNSFPCYFVVVLAINRHFLLSTVDRSGTGQSGSSPRVTLRLNQVRGARDEKKGGGATNSRQGGINAQVYIYTYICTYVNMYRGVPVLMVIGEKVIDSIYAGIQIENIE